MFAAGPFGKQLIGSGGGRELEFIAIRQLPDTLVKLAQGRTHFLEMPDASLRRKRQTIAGKRAFSIRQRRDRQRRKQDFGKHELRIQVKVEFKSTVLLKNGLADDFASRAAGGIAPFRHPLLRTNGHFAATHARQRPPALPARRGASIGSSETGARDWIHFGGDPAVVFWLFQIDPDLGALAETRRKEDRGTRCQDAADQEHERAARTD